jgi:hypothetical protein
MLPSPDILAVVAPNGTLEGLKYWQPPKCDLFIKPRVAAGGEGSDHFRWRGECFESEDGSRLNRKNVVGYLARRARAENRTLLVQPALTNCTELRLGGRSNLATARLVTGLTTHGEVVPIFGIFFHIDRAEKICARHALIDVATAQLSWDPTNGTKENSVEVEKLPYWSRVLRYTRIAHEACSNFVFIGWDVAFTQRGPILLEGNVNWAADDYQRLRGEPLGNTVFANILAAKLSL